MSNIDRRQLLASMAFGSLGADFRAVATPQVTDPRSMIHSNEPARWFLAKEPLQTSAEHIVEFWSTPACKVQYVDQLPPRIVRGAVWQEDEAHRVNPGEKHCLLRGDPEILEFNGLSALGQWLYKNAEAVTRGGIRRTALLALDSASVESKRELSSFVLPAFRRCYDHVIGHFHIEQRGFVHWKTALCGEWGDASGFDEVFTELESQCDCVIFTSQSLAENDQHLSARVSTGTLVSELMCRLGEVLIDKRLIAEIIPPRNIDDEVYPRTFALGSAGASAFSPQISLRDLTRQRELVCSSFGKPVQRPLLIATAASQLCAQNVEKEIAGSNIKFLKTANCVDPKGNGEFLEWFKFVALWPFDWRYGAWP